MGEQEDRGHVFISYDREDADQVELLEDRLRGAGIRVWRDVQDHWPGGIWKRKLHDKIGENSFAFVPCFSRSLPDLTQGVMHEELVWAAEEYRKRSLGVSRIFPVLFDECEVPAITLDGDITLHDLFAENQGQQPERLIEALEEFFAKPSRESPVPVSAVELNQRESWFTRVRITRFINAFSGTRRRLFWALPALVVVAGVVIIARVVFGSSSTVSAAVSPAPYNFPSLHDGMVAVTRSWVLEDQHGSVFTETVKVTNSGGSALQVSLKDPVPTQIAANLQSAKFTATPSKVISSTHVVEWQLRVPAQGSVVVRYSVAVAHSGAAGARLATWAKGLSPMAISLDKNAGQLTLATIHIAPLKAPVSVGSTVQLKLGGSMSNGANALESALAGAVWRSGAPKVAAVNSRGQVVGHHAGTARITVQVGALRAYVTVTVTGTGSSSGSSSLLSPQSPYVYPSSSGGSTGSSHQSSPTHSNPTPTPVPTETATQVG